MMALALVVPTTSRFFSSFEVLPQGRFHQRPGGAVHRHRFESLQHASRLIGDWIHFYNHRRPHQALNMRALAEAFALAA